MSFQPRPCQFCESRNLINMQDDQSRFKVSCLYCGACGPSTVLQADAWQAWNGNFVRAPKNCGSVSETL
jgi:hypothetical protein